MALNQLPVIALIPTGPKQHRLRALQAGIEYCLTLPVSPAELGALLQIIFTGKGERVPTSLAASASGYGDSHVQIDFANRLISGYGKTQTFTESESLILLSLIQNPRKMISSQEPCERTWGRRAWPRKRDVLKTQIHSLRRKIERDPRHPRYLLTRRGLGYMFQPQSDQT